MLADGDPYEREGRTECEGGTDGEQRERERGKTAAWLHPTFYSSVNPIV